VHLLVSHRHRDAGPEPGDDPEVTLVARATDRIRLERDPQVRELREAETRRHDADHRVRHAIDPDRLSDDSAIAAVSPREDGVAEHDHRRGADAVVVAREGTAEHRLRAEQRECFPRHQRAADALGVLGAGNVEWPLDVRAHLRE
jgi:hypothetical protein